MSNHNPDRTTGCGDELDAIRGRIQTARDSVISRGKAAFQAANPSRARHQAERLAILAEADLLLGRLEELLTAAGIAGKPAPPAVPPVEPVLPLPEVEPGPQPGTRRGGPRLPDGQSHAPKWYYPAILRVLEAHSGPMALERLWEAMEPGLAAELNAADRGWLASHKQERWRYVVRWALTQLKKQGLVENPKRGFWKIAGG